MTAMTQNTEIPSLLKNDLYLRVTEVDLTQLQQQGKTTTAKKKHITLAIRYAGRSYYETERKKKRERLINEKVRKKIDAGFS